MAANINVTEGNTLPVLCNINSSTVITERNTLPVLCNITSSTVILLYHQ